MATALRPGGLLLLHFAVPGDTWRTEAQWLADDSLAGRAKLRYGLNCFGRSTAQMVDLAMRSGFGEAVARPLRETVTIPGDDVPDQHLLTARRL
jgi:hypothetical protein